MRPLRAPRLVSPAASAAALIAAAALAGGAVAAPAASVEDNRARFLELSRKKAELERTSSAGKAEADLAAKRTTYAVLDLSERTLQFRIRGFTFKTIALAGIEVDRGGAPVAASAAPQGVFTLQVKEGRGVERESLALKTLTPDEARKAGIKDDDTETLGAEQGEIVEGAPAAGKDSDKPATDAEEKPKMSGVAGGSIPPDPPPVYHMEFDNGLAVRVEAVRDVTGDEARFSWAVSLGQRIGGWFSRGGGDAGVRIVLKMPLSDGQSIFRQLLPGQRLLIVA